MVFTGPIMVFTGPIMVFTGSIMIFTGPIMVFTGPIMVFTHPIMVFTGSTAVPQPDWTYLHDWSNPYASTISSGGKLLTISTVSKLTLITCLIRRRM